MYPEILRIGDFTVSSFGLMMVAAFVAGYFQLASGFRRLGIGDRDDASAVTFAAGVGGILGSKIYYAALYGDWRLLFARYGLVWYGGFALGTLAVIWVARRRRLSVWGVADALLPALALGHGLGRVGCFLVGDDYGVPTDLPWGVAFPRGLPPTRGDELRELGVDLPADVSGDALLAVHPTQIYETLLLFLIWRIGVWWLGRPTRPGTTTGVVLVLMSVERFAIEFLRAKDDRYLGGLTLAQGISLLALALAAVLWSRRPKGPLRPAARPSPKAG